MDKCSVCLENNQSNSIIVRYSSCSHWNCLKCYMLLPSMCPLCRTPITSICYDANTQIFVKDMDNRTTTLSVNLNYTCVDELIYMLTHKLNLKCGVRLLTNTKYMFDVTKTLTEYGITPNATLHIVGSSYAKMPQKIEKYKYSKVLNIQS